MGTTYKSKYNIKNATDYDVHHFETESSQIVDATNLPTANKVVRRDASGRAQVEAPAADKDIANKAYVHQVASEPVSISSLLSWKALDTTQTNGKAIIGMNDRYLWHSNGRYDFDTDTYITAPLALGVNSSSRWFFVGDAAYRVYFSTATSTNVTVSIQKITTITENLASLQIATSYSGEASISNVGYDKANNAAYFIVLIASASSTSLHKLYKYDLSANAISEVPTGSSQLPARPSGTIYQYYYDYQFLYTYNLCNGKLLVRDYKNSGVSGANQFTYRYLLIDINPNSGVAPVDFLSIYPTNPNYNSPIISEFGDDRLFIISFAEIQYANSGDLWQYIRYPFIEYRSKNDLSVRFPVTIAPHIFTALNSVRNVIAGSNKYLATALPGAHPILTARL